METMQPALKNGRNVWDQINMPALEFQQRVSAAREEMREQSMDVLLAYGNAFNEYGNPCYFSNYVIRLPRAALVAIPRRGEVTLFFEGASRGLPSAKTITWIEDVRPCPDVSRGCAGYLKEKGSIPGTIGFAGLKQLMPQYQLKFLTDTIRGCDIVDADSIIRKLRMVKSARECDQVRRASRIVKGLFDFITDSSFPNMNERAVEAMLYREARFEGAEDVRVLFAKPLERKYALRPTEDVTINPGDIVIMFVAVAYERYWSEGIRTFRADKDSFSSPDLEDLEALFGLVTECMKPGKAISQCYKDAISEIQHQNMGYIEEYGLGHCIGLSPNEWPVINEGATEGLKEGMCFTLRLPIKERKLGAVMIGNTLRVSKTGVEVLSS